MDSLISAAARALAAGDVFGALNRVALRNDAPALALRGIAMARLGDLARARALLRAAGRAFGPREALSRARCVVAEAEIALVSRDLAWPTKDLDAARSTLQAHGDDANAAHAGHLQARRYLLVGQLDAAQRTLDQLDPALLAPAARAAHALVIAGLAVRRLQMKVARAALQDAAREAQGAGIAALVAEVQAAAADIDAPAARCITHGSSQLLSLDEVEALLASRSFVIDACRHAVRQAGVAVPLASRPVLFALVRALGDAWPGDASREVLVARAFRGRQADESYRARLRVEMGRLRTLLKPLAGVIATRNGFALQPHRAREVVLLAPPSDDEHGDVLALLVDGQSWSSSALALALGASQRTVQRALETLAAAGKVRPVGLARSRRWMTTQTVPGFTTSLLLPASMPAD
ncbi:helix-turn-helix domain-containing protein [Caenimonas koreensis]|uniref:helix-turn-helix domain-containing protein n=1 Tax=Caenimonas koreensis TaxID=367474 RepID=UPI00378307CF